MKYIKTFESFLSESVKNGVVTCNNKKCGWKWNL